MTDSWSIADGYWDTAGVWQPTLEPTRVALRRAMGADEHPGGPPLFVTPWCVRQGSTPNLNSPADLFLEDGTELRAMSVLPPDLPIGYHDLVPRDGGPKTRLVVSPGACPLPERSWGWQVQLYALRSNDSWGIGDLGDLRRLNGWAASRGARVTMINPLHAATPTLPQQNSPYYSSSRVFRSPLYLRVEEVQGAGDVMVASELDHLATLGRALNTATRIDRDAIFRLKNNALRAVHRRFTGSPEFDAFRRERGPLLRSYATFAALAEHHGCGWPAWPSEHRRPDTAAVGAFAGERAHDIEFYEWCQWQLERQLAAAAGAGTAVIGDLAVGFDPSGADAWIWQDALALGCRVGAPPDGFNASGQDWGLPPFIPWKLASLGYAPFVETVRAAFAHIGGLRIDHVMGLFRLYWIAPGADPRTGTYVSYPATALLDILAIEATRAGAFAVGEDLGTVQDEVRDELRRRNVLSTRLVWFETEPPSAFVPEALASVTTHDLPTIAGVWTGADLAAQRSLGLTVNDDAEDWFRSRLTNASGLTDADDIDDVIVETYRALGASPSLLATASLDDALAVPDRPNFPGTTDEWPNWRIALPRPLEAIELDPLTRRVCEAFSSVRPIVQ
ncbi:MAG: 4-alpha-glucanotransferase [Acidimicrobiia bacterium]